MMSAIYETGLEVSTGTHSILPAQWHYAGRQISMVFRENILNSNHSSSVTKQYCNDNLFYDSERKRLKGEILYTAYNV